MSSTLKMTPQNKRRHTRFTPNAGAFAVIDFSPSHAGFFPTAMALIRDEGTQGSCLVFISPSIPIQGDKLRVQIGDLAPLWAKIVWVTTIEPRVQIIGLEYSE